jgi:hypothetical protein
MTKPAGGGGDPLFVVPPRKTPRKAPREPFSGTFDECKRVGGTRISRPHSKSRRSEIISREVFAPLV